MPWSRLYILKERAILWPRLPRRQPVAVARARVKQIKNSTNRALARLGRAVPRASLDRGRGERGFARLHDVSVVERIPGRTDVEIRWMGLFVAPIVAQ